MPTEDDLYRASSQYRHWNFTPQRLGALRQKTNSLAKEQVRASLKRKRTPISQEQNGSGGGGDGGDAEENNGSGSKADDVVEYLTVDEEKTLVNYFCLQLMTMAQLDTIKFPVNVTATAVQYIKRFYITNSVMSYHPVQITTTALYLATKTENHHNSARSFAAKLAAMPGLKSLTPDDVLAPEYLLVQGLRFCFDVRHPHRALKGAYLDLKGLLSIARGDPAPESWSQTGKGLARKLQQHLLDRYGVPAKFSKRIETAYKTARETLQRQAVLSDVYFLYTPAQIMMAALWMADDKIVSDLLHAKASVVPDSAAAAATTKGSRAGAGIAAGDGLARATVDRILDEIEACAAELQKTELDDDLLVDEARRIDRKLHFCRNPDKLDLVKMNQATKRDATENGKLDDNLAKKRKVDREKMEKEGDDLFGPTLVKKEGS